MKLGFLFNLGTAIYNLIIVYVFLRIGITDWRLKIVSICSVISLLAAFFCWVHA